VPYIKQVQREKLEPHLAGLAEAIKELAGQQVDFAGILNYCCTTLALSVIPEKKYANIALVSGVFSNISDEFYRRYAAGYEDEAIDRNGDVY